MVVKIFDPSTMTELPLGSEGEICATGPSVMKGYRNNEQANADVFFTGPGSKRYFRTGDLGTFVDGKYLKITGRIKEQYKLENGKYVVPAPLEDAICRSRYIAQSFVYGDNKPHNVVLIIPEIIELRKYADMLGLRYINEQGVKDDNVLLNTDEIKGLLSKEILQCSISMKSYEKPIKWDYELGLFTQENNMLTPKMSIRRANIMKVYGPRIFSMYTSNTGVTIRNYVSNGVEIHP